MKKKLYWNFLISLAFESYILVAMCALINLQQLGWDNFGASTSSLSTLIALVAVVGLPIFVGVFLYCKWDKLKDKEVIEKFGVMYEDLDLDQGRWVASVPLVFILRRLHLCMIIMFMNHAAFQLQSINFALLYVMIQNGSIEPFKTKTLAHLDLFNELSILLIFYHMLVFTPFVHSADRKTEAGWSVIVVTVINIVINLAYLAISSIRQLIRKCRDKKLRKANEEALRKRL